jgi:quinone-modifying oxidoreductase subunit QmoC
MKAGAAWDAIPVTKTKPLLLSIGAALKTVITHRDFGECTSARPRFWSHISVFFGFLALTMVTLWVITSSINPLAGREFVYPFGFWSPWKILANLGGAAVLVGCFLMVYERTREGQPGGASTYADWAFLSLLTLVVLTGFITEVLHYVRLEPHRHLAYFVHLLFACALLLYLPYSKFAHLIYRVTALVYAEHVGRGRFAVTGVGSDTGRGSSSGGESSEAAAAPGTDEVPSKVEPAT